MVDINTLDRANILIIQRRQVMAALTAFNEGARIIAFALPSPSGPNMQLWIDTLDINYPPQMTETIKHILAERQEQLDDEIAGLGISGIDLRR